MYKILLALFSVVYCVAKAQSPVSETVGTPTSVTTISSYSGWVNPPAIMSYSGNAEVQNAEPSTNTYASGGGNVYFTNTPGVYLEAKWLNPAGWVFSDVFPTVTFSMHNFDVVNNANELVLELSSDNGNSYQSMPYHRLGGSMFASGQWNVMEAVSGASISFNGPLIFRFRQTSSAKTFRIDDLSFSWTGLLPLRVVQFTGTKSANANNISWKISTQNNPGIVTLEKSNNGKEYTGIFTHTAKGNGESSFSYADIISRSESKYYYRLKMVNADGRLEYSRVLLLKNVAPDELIQHVSQMPASSTVNLQLNSPVATKGIIQIFNAAGQLQYLQVRELLEGINSLQLNVTSLTPGIYCLKVVAGAQSQTRQWMITR